jgi:hypothetical protein
VDVDALGIVDALAKFSCGVERALSATAATPMAAAAATPNSATRILGRPLR